MSERLIISSPCIVGGYFGDNLGQLVLAGIGVSKMVYLRSARRFDPSDKTGQNSEKSPQCGIFWLSSGYLLPLFGALSALIRLT